MTYRKPLPEPQTNRTERLFFWAIIVLATIAMTVAAIRIVSADDSFLPLVTTRSSSPEQRLNIGWTMLGWPDIGGRPVDCIGSPPELCGVACFYVEPETAGNVGVGGKPEPGAGDPVVDPVTVSRPLSCIPWRFDDPR